MRVRLALLLPLLRVHTCTPVCLLNDDRRMSLNTIEIPLAHHNFCHLKKVWAVALKSHPFGGGNLPYGEKPKPVFYWAHKVVLVCLFAVGRRRTVNIRKL